MFLAYTVINPHAYDGGLINPVLSQIFAVLSILVFECSVFILTLQGAKKYAATCAVISYVIITTYLSIESYNANGGFTYAWGLSTFLGALWTFVFVGAIYVFSDILAGKIELLKTDDQLKSLVGELESKLKSTESKLTETENKLRGTEIRLSETETKLHETEMRFSEVETKLHETETKLGETENKLRGTEIRLSETENKLKVTEPEMKRYKVAMDILRGLNDTLIQESNRFGVIKFKEQEVSLELTLINSKTPEKPNSLFSKLLPPPLPKPRAMETN